MTFKILNHVMKPEEMVEVRDGKGRVVAAIYSGDDGNSIRVVSAHLTGMAHLDGPDPLSVATLCFQHREDRQ